MCDLVRGRVARVGVLLAGSLTLALLMSVPAALAGTAPHVTEGPETDSCAICHRAHTAASDTTTTIVAGSFEIERNALILGTWDDGGDTGMCFVCHGVDSLGADIDVQTSFTRESSHTLAPAIGEFGPRPMQCSSCHDSHGTDRDTDGEPYAALLRARSATDPATFLYQGDVYCSTCHESRPASLYDGLTVWQQSAHAGIPAPGTGTQIVCSVCHDPHGSDNPPLITEQLTPPSTPSTISVSANDRTFCFSCHSVTYATYDGAFTYQTGSHALSSALVTPTGEWATGADPRPVGECQNCHAPMGASDGAGGIVPKLTNAAGREQCYLCHGSASSIATDMARFAFPATETVKPELAVAYGSLKLGAEYDRLALYSQETAGAIPRGFTGPRVYRTETPISDMAYGDIEGDGRAALVIGDSSDKYTLVFVQNELTGLSLDSYKIDVTPAFVGIGDVLVDASGLPEVAVIERDPDPPHTSELWLYRWNGTGLVDVVRQFDVGEDVSGMAIGNVAGSAADDIVLTSLATATSGDTLSVLTESATTPGDLDTLGPWATRRGPRGPSIGDADASSAGLEIAIANSGEVTGTVSILTGSGTSLGSYDATASAGSRAWDTVIGDVLPGQAGAETVVALRHATGTSAVNIFGRSSTSGLLTPPQSVNTGLYYNSASLAIGDIDSDGDAELAVGNAGRWGFDASTNVAPSVQLFQADAAGTSLDITPRTLWSEGAELAGIDPAVVIGDLGPVGESRHPDSAVPAAHNSTETPTFTRHSECTDCHNVHEATSTPAAAPLVYGRLKGSWGVSVTNDNPNTITYTERQGVVYEYETCFKCHSGWTETPGSSGDIASQVNTRNASFHAIETSTTNAMATGGSFTEATPAWSNTSVLYCIDCHTNGDPSEPVGPHSSEDAPLLASPYYGVRANAPDFLCYDCHKSSVYYTGSDDGVVASTSNFYDADLTNPKLHAYHVAGRGFSCGACHVSHGLDNEHLLREVVGYTHDAVGGYCENECHTTGSPTAERHDYYRP